MSEIPEAGGEPLRSEGEEPRHPASGCDRDPPSPRRQARRPRPGAAAGAAQPRGPLHARGLGLPRRRAWTTADGADEAGFRAAAVRELSEEAGIEVDAAELVAYSRWITPRVVPIRFDTLFFLALAPAHSPPKPDGSETVDAGWYAPQRALDLHREGEMALVFPTIKHLESLLPYANAAEALAKVSVAAPTAAASRREVARRCASRSTMIESVERSRATFCISAAWVSRS